MFHVEQGSFQKVVLFHVEQWEAARMGWSGWGVGKGLDPGHVRVKDVPDDRQLSRYCKERPGGRRAGGITPPWF